MRATRATRERGRALARPLARARATLASAAHVLCAFARTARARAQGSASAPPPRQRAPHAARAKGHAGGACVRRRIAARAAPSRGGRGMRTRPRARARALRKPARPPHSHANPPTHASRAHVEFQSSQVVHQRSPIFSHLPMRQLGARPPPRLKMRGGRHIFVGAAVTPSRRQRPMPWSQGRRRRPAIRPTLHARAPPGSSNLRRSGAIREGGMTSRTANVDTQDARAGAWC